MCEILEAVNKKRCDVDIMWYRKIPVDVSV
jgi:hypothetical protein